MNEEQLEKIERKIILLKNIKIRFTRAYEQFYVAGQINILEWVKENI